MANSGAMAGTHRHKELVDLVNLDIEPPPCLVHGRAVGYTAKRRLAALILEQTRPTVKGRTTVAGRRGSVTVPAG